MTARHHQRVQLHGLQIKGRRSEGKDACCNRASVTRSKITHFVVLSAWRVVPASEPRPAFAGRPRRRRPAVTTLGTRSDVLLLIGNPACAQESCRIGIPFVAGAVRNPGASLGQCLLPPASYSQG